MQIRKDSIFFKIPEYQGLITSKFLRCLSSNNDALKYVSKKALVLVIKGNHDDDFEGTYSIRRINKIPKCNEISGKSVTLCGLTFLGLGFNEIHCLKLL